MKITPLLLLAPALWLSPAFAQDQTEAEVAPVTVPKPRVAADAFMWKFAPPLGSRWQIRSFERTEIKSAGSLADGTTEARVSTDLTSFVADYDVLSRDQFGATTSRITLREMKFDGSGTINGQTVTTSTDRTMALQKMLQNVSFTVKQAPTGEIWGVAGTEAVANRIATAIAPYELSDAAQAKALQQKAQMMTDFLIGPAVLRQILGLGQSPAYPVVTSESWPYTVPLPAGFPFGFDLTGKRTLNRLTPELAFIASDATYDSSAASVAPVLMRNSGPFSSGFSSAKASVRGAARVERSSGLTLESTSTWRVSSTNLAPSAVTTNATATGTATGTATIEVHTLLVPR